MKTKAYLLVTATLGILLLGPTAGIGAVLPVECGLDTAAQSCRVDATVQPACVRQPCPGIDGSVQARNRGTFGSRDETAGNISYRVNDLGIGAAPGFIPLSGCGGGFYAPEGGPGAESCDFVQVGGHIRVRGFAIARTLTGYGYIRVRVFDFNNNTAYGGCDYASGIGAGCDATLAIAAPVGTLLRCGAEGYYEVVYKCETY